MVISNWDGDKGNYLYYNRLFDADLECEGSLSWTDIKPGESVTESFEVMNSGGEETLLDWEITEYPDWGEWNFQPSSGEDLQGGESISIEVEVIAPGEENTLFEGEIKIENSDSPNDFCIIPVSLKTKYSVFVFNLQSDVSRVSQPQGIIGINIS
jgi:hypothetical protein